MKLAMEGERAHFIERDFNRGGADGWDRVVCLGSHPFERMASFCGKRDFRSDFDRDIGGNIGEVRPVDRWWRELCPVVDGGCCSVVTGRQDQAQSENGRTTENHHV